VRAVGGGDEREAGREKGLRDPSRWYPGWDPGPPGRRVQPARIHGWSASPSARGARAPQSPPVRGGAVPRHEKPAGGIIMIPAAASARRRRRG
jgi:hypothetical protein